MSAVRKDEAERVASLSEKQRNSLRLTYHRKTSKEIAKLAGVTPYAIDAQIERAKQRLGVTSRIEAAELVMRYAPVPYERLIYELPNVAEHRQTESDRFSPEGPAPQDAFELAEAHAAYVPPRLDLSGGSGRVPWGRPDDLSPIARALLIPAAAFIIVSIVLTLIAAGEQGSKWASRVLPAYQHSK